jgi:hypothetical protein
VINSVAVVPKASVLTMALDRATIGNSGSDTVNVVATAKDSSNNALEGIKVTFSVDQNAVLVPGNLVTDKNGQAKAAVQIGADRSNRTVKVTTTSDSLKDSKEFTVTGAKLQASAQPAALKANEAGVLDYTLTDVNANPMAGVDAVVFPPSPAASQALKTDSQGKFRYSYTVPAATAAGPYVVSANAGGAAISTTVQVDSKIENVPTATNISSATFTAAPLVVSVNPIGKTDNRAELRLLFRSENNVPIPNVRVLLSFAENASATDGDISSGKDGVITSDANGVAVSSFISGQRSSPTGQLKVFACYAKDDSLTYVNPKASTLEFQPWLLPKTDSKYRAFKGADCKSPNQLTSVSLTVVEQPVSISIGTNELVQIGASKNTYMQEFVVLVVDAAGNPKADVQLSPIIDLPSYRKGYYLFDDVLKKWIRRETVSCLNEDSSPGTGYRNGTIELFNEDKDGSGILDPSEDLNGNGKLDLDLSEDKNNNSILDAGEDLNGNGILDLHLNEDKNGNGKLDLIEDLNGNGILDKSEDVNGNGQLDPRKSDVSISMVGSTKTDANGLAILRVEYPQSMGSWVEFSVRVSATGVLSPPAWTGRLAAEGDTLATLKGISRFLIVPIDVIKNEADPPFRVSPYGTVGSCAIPN